MWVKGDITLMYKYLSNFRYQEHLISQKIFYLLMSIRRKPQTAKFEQLRLTKDNIYSYFNEHIHIPYNPHIEIPLYSQTFGGDSHKINKKIQNHPHESI